MATTKKKQARKPPASAKQANAAKRTRERTETPGGNTGNEDTGNERTGAPTLNGAQAWQGFMQTSSQYLARHEHESIDSITLSKVMIWHEATSRQRPKTKTAGA